MDLELEQLQQSVIFSRLSSAETALVAGTMTRRCVAERQTVFEQGVPGDSLFVLASGRLSVRCRREGKRGLVVADALPGTVFGEMACVDPGSRSATIDVVEDAIVYELARTTLLSLQTNAPSVAASILSGIARIVSDRLRGIDELLQTRLPALPRNPISEPAHGIGPESHRSEVPDPLDPDHVVMPHGFEASDLKLLQGAGRTWAVEAGAVLCHQGEIGRTCFVLLRGKLEVLRSGPDGPILLAVLDPGTLVGHMALIDRVERSASLRVRQRAVVIELDRDDFERLMLTASPFSLRFQEHLAVVGSRQLRTALEVLKISPDPPEKTTRTARGVTSEGESDDEHRTAARFLASLKEWSLGIDSAAEVSYVDHDGDLDESEMAARAGS